jgi:hypothetical protein
VADAEVARELALERLHLRAEDEPAAVDDLGELGVDVGAQRGQRRAGVEQRDGHGGATP